MKKSLIYTSIVDISDKNGQSLYALKTLESFVKCREYSSLDVILPKPKNLGELDFLFSYNGVKVHYLDRKIKNKDILWHNKIQVQTLFRLIKIGKKDALIYSLKPSIISNLIYSKIFNVKSFLLIEGYAKSTVRNIMVKFLSTIGLKILELNIKNSYRSYPAYQLADKWVQKIVKNENSSLTFCGVDYEVFQHSQKIKTNSFTIGYVGSFRKIHLLEELIISCNDLNISLLLIGDGAEKDNLIELVSKKNIKNIQFIEKQNQKNLTKYFSKCDIMWGAIDNNHWGLPMKVFEYLACNKKVIITKREEFDFIKKFKYGFELTNTSVESIKSLLLKIKEDSNIDDNINSRDYVKKISSWDMFPKKVIKDLCDS